MTQDTSHPFAQLFEPLTIGPVTAKNRFYQVPHCTGLGHANPKAEVALRATKAEGGWGVVCTQEVEVHPSSDISPALEGRMWDDADIPMHAAMTDAVHEHGALAGIELVHNGLHTANLGTRIPPIAPTHRPVDSYYPVQARGMNKSDIRNLRKWYVDAAIRSQQAGYDIVYVYAGHNMATLMHFLLVRYNDRTDEYGGNLVNRVRLLKETLCDVRDAVGENCGIALRFAVDELLGKGGLQAEDEGREIVSMLADIPDLWDVNISGWANDSATARFEPDEGYQEQYTAFVKQLVNKPVVGVGRFTSPTAMVSQINRGVLDFIGAARPSIADPFLPNKILANDIEAIRECIGCNICVSSDNVVSPIRCTQNPTMGEEWRRGWHPERNAKTAQPEQTLVVGAGPAGLECAHQLAKQGYKVMLAEAGLDVGGRLLNECQLPGLASYRRVRDYRAQQLSVLSNVELLLDNQLSAQDIIDTEFPHVFIATGATWRRDGMGRQHPLGLPALALPAVNSAIDENSLLVLTPDDIFAGIAIPKHVLVYDDDHYYMGGVLAESLVNKGHNVTLVTPANCVSAWTEHTLEQYKIQTRLLQLGVRVIVAQAMQGVNENAATLSCIYTDNLSTIKTDAVVMVTSRSPVDDLYKQCNQMAANMPEKFKTLINIGDSHSPSTVAAAVYAGHLAARMLEDDTPKEPLFFRREMPQWHV